MNPDVRSRVAWLLPAAFTLTWLVFVLANNHLDRVTGHWRSSVTMAFGSFVAGSTPQGSGSVAFPVFTKVLDIPASVSRSLGLDIQSMGMVMASAIILITGRQIDRKATRLGIMGGTVGFAIGALVLGDPTTTFWESRIPTDYVKVTFTIAVAMVASIVWLCAGRDFRVGSIDDWTRRGEMGLIGFAALGGALSALTGPGVNVFVFLFAVLIAGLNPRIGIPTSILTMAWVSVLGLVFFGIVQGQLDITLTGDQVVAVGGSPIEPLPADRVDVYGIWLAAAPIVVWGAPFGSWVAARLSQTFLIGFVATMAATELVTTIVFLDALRTNAALGAYFVIGLGTALAGTIWAARRGPAAFGFVPAEPDRRNDPDEAEAPREPSTCADAHPSPA